MLYNIVIGRDKVFHEWARALTKLGEQHKANVDQNIKKDSLRDAACSESKGPNPSMTCAKIIDNLLHDSQHDDTSKHRIGSPCAFRQGRNGYQLLLHVDIDVSEDKTGRKVGDEGGGHREDDGDYVWNLD